MDFMCYPTQWTEKCYNIPKEKGGVIMPTIECVTNTQEESNQIGYICSPGDCNPVS